MAILPAYTEPHSASPGNPYALREKLLHGDVNQIVANQKALWDALLRVTNLVIEEEPLGLGINRVGGSFSPLTPAAYTSVTYGDTISKTSLLAGDIISGVAGPYAVTNHSSGTCYISMAIFSDALGTPAAEGNAAIFPLPANFDRVITFPFIWKPLSAPGYINMQLSVKAVGGTVDISGVDDNLTHGIYRITRPT